MISIQEAKQAKKGDIQGTVVAVGNLKSGTKDGQDWSSKAYTLEDSSGSVSVTLWNEKVNDMEMGKTYKIEKGWWKSYNDITTLTPGNYGNILLVDDPVPTQPQPTNANTGIDKQLAKHRLCIKYAKDEAVRYYSGRQVADDKIDIMTSVIYKALMELPS